MSRFERFDTNPLMSKADAQQMVIDLYEPLLPYHSDGCAIVDMEEGAAFFDMEASYIEAIARPLWGIVPLVVGGGEFPYWDTIVKAIVNGTNPSHPEYWGETRDTNQRSVEMGAFGFMLMFCPEHCWGKLSDIEKERFAHWLANIQHVTLPQTNWLFFAVFVQEGLSNVGYGHLVDYDLQSRLLEKLSGMYLGEGWYGDGDPMAIDHYGGFALHTYGLLYARYKGLDHPQSQVFIERANIFATSFKYWFSDDGDALMIGRSLTYRFACNAFWGALAVAEQSPIPTSEIRSLWVKHLRSWQGKSIFNADGVLNRGYYYPNLLTSEPYNSPTSPYWAMKAFLPLMLDSDSSFWACPETDVEYPESILSLPTAKHIIQRFGGHSIVHYGAPVHEWLQVEKYNKFAYSTHFGFDVASLLYAQMNSFGDNLLAFSFDGGDNWQMKNRMLSTVVDGQTLITEWQSGKLRVKTRIDVLEKGIVKRTHQFVLHEPAIVIESGFALDQWYSPATIFTLEGEDFVSNAGLNLLSDNVAAKEKGSIFAENKNGIVGMKSLDGNLKKMCVCNRTNTNVASPQTVIPFSRAEIPAGEHTLTSVFLANPTPGQQLIISFDRVK